MTMIFRSNRWAQRAGCATLIASLAGCSTLRPVAAPEQYLVASRPDRVWVTQADSSKVMVEGPRLLGDTLVGWVAGRYAEMPLPGVRMVSVRQPAPRRTALLVGGVAVLSAALLSVLASGGPPTYIPGPEDPATLFRRR